jgi:hypothetical protein
MSQLMRDSFHIKRGIFGNNLEKGPLSLPQNATATLATVTGGLVSITSLFGYVTTAIGATAMNLSLGTAPLTGVTSTGGISAATPFASTPVGSWLVPLQSAGVAGQLGIGANGAAIFLPTPLVVSAGTITWTTTANNTGAVKWFFTWVAMDTGAALS